MLGIMQTELLFYLRISLAAQESKGAYPVYKKNPKRAKCKNHLNKIKITFEMSTLIFSETFY